MHRQVLVSANLKRIVIKYRDDEFGSWFSDRAAENRNTMPDVSVLCPLEVQAAPRHGLLLIVSLPTPQPSTHLKPETFHRKP